MKKTRFDLEDEIMDCWGVVSDLSTVLEYLDDDFFEGMSPAQQDKLSNLLLGMTEMYDVKFFKMFNTFAGCIEEFDGEVAQIPLAKSWKLFPDDGDTPPWNLEDDDYDHETRLNDATPSEWDKATDPK